MLLRYALDVAPLWNTPAEFNTALHLLPPSTYKAIKAFHFPTDRKLALGSQLLQRLLIAHIYPHFGALHEISISRDPASGRPYYTIPAAHREQEVQLLDFNVSHHAPKPASAGGAALVVLVARVGDGKDARRVGVDVVPVSHKGAVGEWLETFRGAGVFTPSELWRIFTPEDEGGQEGRVRKLYTYWALKEAYFKAVGTGLVADLLSVEFGGVRMEVLEGGGRDVDVEVYVGGVREAWRVEVGALCGHYVAVATDAWGKGEDEGVWEWVKLEGVLERWGGKDANI